MVIGIDSSRAFQKDKTGTENYSYQLVTQMLTLPEAKSHVFVLFTRPNAIIPDQIKLFNVIIQPIQFRYLWTQVGLAYQTWRKPHIEVLWVPAHTLPVLRPPKLKTVVTIHGLEYQWLKEYHNFLQRWYLPLSTIYATRSANQLIAVSRFTKHQLVDQLHTNSNKIKVIQEGVQPLPKVATEPIMRKFQIQARQYGLFVGTIQPRKNLVALIQAFSEYQKDFPEEKLVIAGGVGWSAQEVLAAPTRLGIPDKVVFTGRVNEEELAGLYQAAKYYVQPSITEGFGLPVLEAMLAGLPTIVSAGGALPETAGPSAIVVQLGSQFVSGLTKAMKRVGGSKEYAQVSSAGVKWAKTWTWAKAAKMTLLTLTSL